MVTYNAKKMTPEEKFALILMTVVAGLFLLSYGVSSQNPETKSDLYMRMIVLI